jgi:hypothetical protein
MVVLVGLTRLRSARSGTSQELASRLDVAADQPLIRRLTGEWNRGTVSGRVSQQIRVGAVGRTPPDVARPFDVTHRLWQAAAS